MSGRQMRRKEAFFNNLRYFRDYAVPWDEETDKGWEASMYAMEWCQRKTRQVVVDCDSLPLLSILPDIDARSSSQSPTRFADKSVLSAHVDPTLNLHVPRKQNSIYPEMTSGKRKRDSSGVARNQQGRKIFQGLSFYFIPNNDISPVRRMRIRKAIEHGASWVQQWNPSVTHVIVDKGLNYVDVLKSLKLEELPATTILVSENYPAECLSWRCLVQPTQRMFLVDGQSPKQLSNNRGPRISIDSLQIEPMRGIEPQISSRTGDSHEEPTNVKLQESFTSAKDSEAKVAYARDKEAPSETSKDLWGEAIVSAKETVNLPLDSDDEDCSDEVYRPTQKRLKGTFSGNLNWAQNFQCMKPHNPTPEETMNPNKHTIDVLEKMQNYYESVKDQWRSRAYRQCLATLRKQKTCISSKEQAAALPFVGERLAAKIEEIFWTKRLRRLENAKLEPTEQALNLFLGIHGVGTVQAMQWVEQGHRSLEDLREKASLTPTQKVGLEHYEDFTTRIPRSEAEQLGAIVTSKLHEIDPEFQTIIGGSYRRGAKDSGDIDILITKKDTTPALLRTAVVETLVPRLQEIGFLVAALAVTNRDTGSKWQGACQLPHPSTELNTRNSKPNPNPWRRIDLLIVPPSEFGAALIYFTGNDIFNRSMRLLARRKGLSLNQKGLFKDVWRDRHTNARTEGTKIAGETEKGVFEALGVPWREAWERNI